MCVLQLCRESLILPQRYHCGVFHLSAKATSFKLQKPERLTFAAGPWDAAVFQEHISWGKGCRTSPYSTPQTLPGTAGCHPSGREGSTAPPSRGPGGAMRRSPEPWAGGSIRLHPAPSCPGNAHPVPRGPHAVPRSGIATARARIARTHPHPAAPYPGAPGRSALQKGWQRLLAFLMDRVWEHGLQGTFPETLRKAALGSASGKPSRRETMDF